MTVDLFPCFKLNGWFPGPAPAGRNRRERPPGGEDLGFPAYRSLRIGSVARGSQSLHRALVGARKRKWMSANVYSPRGLAASPVGQVEAGT
jgi:hypothetical protein